MSPLTLDRWRRGPSIPLRGGPVLCLTVLAGVAQALAAPPAPEPAASVSSTAEVNMLDAQRRVVSEAAKGPWSLVVADGSANVTTVTFDGKAATWRYRPVTPAESSSGVYSGGEPASGALDAAAAQALYRALLDVAHTSGRPNQGPRAMGEAQLRVTDAEGQRGWVTSRGQATQRLLAPLLALRQPAPP